jgi:hypothetical protein
MALHVVRFVSVTSRPGFQYDYAMVKGSAGRTLSSSRSTGAAKTIKANPA